MLGGGGSVAFEGFIYIYAGRDCGLHLWYCVTCINMACVGVGHAHWRTRTGPADWPPPRRIAADGSTRLAAEFSSP